MIEIIFFDKYVKMKKQAREQFAKKKLTIYKLSATLGGFYHSWLNVMTEK